MLENKSFFRKYNISTNTNHGIDNDGKNNLKFWNISNPYEISELETFKENNKYYVVKNDSVYKARELGLLQKFSSNVINENIKPELKDPDGYWTPITYRARI